MMHMPRYLPQPEEYSYHIQPCLGREDVLLTLGDVTIHIHAAKYQGDTYDVMIHRLLQHPRPSRLPIVVCSDLDLEPWRLLLMRALWTYASDPLV